MQTKNSLYSHIDEPYGPYAHLYQHFFANRHTHHGYHFGEAPTVRVSPPLPIHHSRPLKWWSWDRPERLQKVRAERDRRLQEIVILGNTTQHQRAGTGSPLNSSPACRQPKERKRETPRGGFRFPSSWLSGQGKGGALGTRAVGCLRCIEGLG